MRWNLLLGVLLIVVGLLLGRQTIRDEYERKEVFRRSEYLRILQDYHKANLLLDSLTDKIHSRYYTCKGRMDNGRN